MIYFPLISIPIIFLIVAMLKPILPKGLSKKACAICLAVALTWLILLFLSWTGVVVDPMLIGILMGMSVVGMMYKLEDVFQRRQLKHFWLIRLCLVVGGLYFVLAVLSGQWGIAFLLGLILSLVITIVGFLMQGVTHSQALRSAHVNGQNKSILKKLDDCC